MWEQQCLSIPSTVNPLLNLPGGLFIWNIFEGEGVGLVETGGLFEMGGGLNLAKTMASVLYKELQYKVEKLKYKKLEVMQACRRGSKTNPNFQLVNKPSRISPHEVLQSWLINTVYYSFVKNNKGEGREG